MFLFLRMHIPIGMFSFALVQSPGLIPMYEEMHMVAMRCFDADTSEKSCFPVALAFESCCTMLLFFALFEDKNFTTSSLIGFLNSDVTSFVEIFILAEWNFPIEEFCPRSLIWFDGSSSAVQSVLLFTLDSPSFETSVFAVDGWRTGSPWSLEGLETGMGGGGKCWTAGVAVAGWAAATVVR